MNVQKIKEGKTDLIIGLVVLFVTAIAMANVIAQITPLFWIGVALIAYVAWAILLASYIASGIMKIIEGSLEKSE